jgi:hypothetical protein
MLQRAGKIILQVYVKQTKGVEFWLLLNCERAISRTCVFVRGKYHIRVDENVGGKFESELCVGLMYII